MKRFLYIFIFAISLFIGFAFKPINIYADENSCKAHGGLCNGVACTGEKETVYDENGIAITCGYQQVCCKTKSEFLTECEQYGGKCFSSAPNPSLYSPLSRSCNSGQSCYKIIQILQSCSLPGVCTSSPGGVCPNGKKQYSGTCTGYQELCCEYEAPSKLPMNLDINKKYCDSSGNSTATPTERLYTAIGCIPVGNLESFISSILGWAIGIGGGVAFLLIVYSGFMIMTSSGNPERLKAGQELLTSAMAGLIMLIFSVFILRVIGVDILKIPGIK